MAIYSIGINTTVTTTGNPAADIKAGTGNIPRILEVGLNLITATASTYGLIRSSNVPSQNSAVALIPENPNDPASLTNTAVAWSTAPTIGSVHLRRASFPATVGVSIIWTFPRGLGIPATNSIVIWNLATNSNSTNIWFVVDE